MLTVSKVDLLYDLKQPVTVKNNDTSKKYDKDTCFNTYLKRGTENKHSSKLEVCDNENCKEADVIDLDEVTVDGNVDLDEVGVDVFSLIGLYTPTLNDAKDGLAITVGGEDFKGMSDLPKGSDLFLMVGSVSDDLNLKNILTDNDLDVLNNIVNEEGSISDLSIEYVEYDYFEKDNVGVNDIVEPTVLMDSDVLDMDGVAKTSTNERVVSPYIVRQDMFVKDMLSNIDYMSKEGIQRIKLQLSPKDLGTMVVEIVKTAESSKMVITLSKEDLYKVVQNNIKELNSQLVTLNVKVSEVSVELKTDLNNGFMGKEAENQNQDHSNKNGRHSKNNRDTRCIEDIVNCRSVNIIKDDKVLLCV